MYRLDITPEGTGTNLYKIGTGRRPVWSPNGLQIAYIAAAQPAGRGSKIYLTDTIGRTTTYVQFSPSIDIPIESLSWSSDGTRLAFSAASFADMGQSHSIFWVQMSDGMTIRLTDDQGDDQHPQWLPDGRIAFLSNWQSPTRRGQAALFTMSENGVDYQILSSYRKISVFDWYFGTES
jgi:Tol biopolymer transport system component